MNIETSPQQLLIVDDSEGSRVTLQLLFEDAGYAVETADSYREGLARVRRPGVKYDLVLLDEHLGDGLGSQLAPIARQHLPAARLVLLSGSLSYAETVLVADQVDAALDKNAEFPEILKVVQKLLP